MIFREIMAYDWPIGSKVGEAEWPRVTGVCVWGGLQGGGTREIMDAMSHCFWG